MSPQQENSVGAQEHQKAIKSFGLYQDESIQRYVNDLGQRVVTGTERADVQYKFYVIDTPDVNAFALPGGYIYVSRGLLALANSEAEVAGVLSHEAGHITARHTAERYSQSVVTGLGAAVLSAAVNAPGASRAIGVGSDLFLKSYSRSQESEADQLGLRYLHQAGYDVYALPNFLRNLQREEQIEGTENASRSYFSTHPATGDRVAVTSRQAGTYPSNKALENRALYLRKIEGITYGDTSSQGFVRGNTFFHPEIGFALDVPEGYKISNQTNKLVTINPSSGAGLILDTVPNRGLDPLAYLLGPWANGKPLAGAENITINGFSAATGSFSGSVNNVPATIRLVAVDWSSDLLFRMQIALPDRLPNSEVAQLKKASYSFRRLSERERSIAKVTKIRLVSAKNGDTAESLGAQMADGGDRQDPVALFRVLNGLGPSEQPKSGQLYKIIAN